MGKLTTSVSRDNLPQVLTFIEAEFKYKPSAACILESMKQAAEEIILTVADAGDYYSSIILDVSISKEGCCIQFLYPGPIFNPCSSDRNLCPYTVNEMDEISFEFKYGHSVVAIYKKIPFQNAQ